MAAILTTGAAAQALPVPLALLSVSPGQAPGWQSSAHTALNRGIECYRQGDYEAAAQALSQAQLGRNDLSAGEQQELANCQKFNNQALQAQRAGHEQLRQAEMAVQNGRTAEADALLKSMANNPYVSASDKLKAQMLVSQVHAREMGMPSMDTSGQSPALLARLKLQRARMLMRQGDFDAAVALAEEAAKLGAMFRPGEDTPGRVLEDIQRAQSDPKALLLAARSAFKRGDLDTAERMAHQADHMAYAWTFLIRGDSPSRLLHDIQIQRARQVAGATATSPAVANTNPAIPAPTSDQTSVSMSAQPSVPGLPITAGANLSANVSVGGVDVPPQPQMPQSPIGPNALVQSSGTPAALPGQDMNTPAQTGPATVDPRMEQARALLAEARTLQKADRLVEAYQKVVEAQRMGVVFGMSEENPQTVRLELCAQASRRMETLMDQAGADVTAGKQDPLRYAQGEAKLAQAREVAVGFGLDCHPIDMRVAQLRQARDGVPVPNDMLPPVEPGSATALVGGISGPQLLEKARKEIRAGHNEAARHLCEQAFQGPYGVKSEAEALLRTICAEEASQRCKTADRLFDAGMSMYRRRDFAQARDCFAQIDVSALSPDKQARLREISAAPELQPHDIIQATAHASELSEPGKATASDTPGKSHLLTPEQNFAKQVEALQQVEFEKLRWEGNQAQRQALERARASDPEQALEILEAYLAKLKESKLEPDKIALLRRPIDARIEAVKKVRAEIAAEMDRDASRREWAAKKNRSLQQEAQKQKDVAQLMDQWQALYKAHKYEQAFTVAEKAHELDPDDVRVAAAVQASRMARNHQDYQEERQRREDRFVKVMNQAEEPGPAVGDKDPLAFDKDRWTIADKRSKRNTDITLPMLRNDKEKEIENHLKMPVQISFNNTPLRQVLRELSAENGINIVPDQASLEQENISLDAPLSLQVEGIQLESALNLLLNQVHLTHVIQNEVLLVTTEAKASGRLVRRIFQVADIIVPIEDHGIPPTLDTQTMIERSIAKPGQAIKNPAVDDSRGVLPGGTPIATSNGTGGTTSQWATTISGGRPRPAGQTIQDLLMDLITNTVKPESWSKVGGPGTIDYYPLGMALVINQTPDIQEQVAQLLEALRRLQDIEVTVELRFITLDEAFYERIGVDFGVNFVNRQTKYQPQLVNGSFAPAGYINAFTPGQFVSGITSVASGPTTGGSLTPDLGIPIQPGSFGPAVPPFGGFQNAPPDGGLQLGLAFLSDIQVYMLLEAAQADRRTNVMQAPKITMFNGQTSTITVTDSQYYVSAVAVYQDNGQLVFVPTNTPIPTGLTLAIQSVVSADRRFVRMNLFPNLTNIASPVTALFPVTTFITPVFEGGSQGQPIPFTQYLQQPSFQNVTVTTSVSVPDGGTVLLGGLKTLREGRNEFGPPILSQLPYINRLFKNVGYGRETESLMMMVTPRIIINEEEEDLQVNQGRAGLLGGTSGPGGLSAARPEQAPAPAPAPGPAREQPVP